jgi:hypothetical protein
MSSVFPILVNRKAHKIEENPHQPHERDGSRRGSLPSGDHKDDSGKSHFNIWVIDGLGQVKDGLREDDSVRLGRVFGRQGFGQQGKKLRCESEFLKVQATMEDALPLFSPGQAPPEGAEWILGVIHKTPKHVV